MTHCPNCAKEINKPSRVLTKYSFTVEYYNCKKCHHNFKVTTNRSKYVTYQKEAMITGTAFDESKNYIYHT